MDNAGQSQSRRGWLKMLAAGAGGAVLGGVALKCCSGKKSLPQCTLSPPPNTLNVVVHGMAAMGVFPASGGNPSYVLLVLPAIPGHQPMAGTLDNLITLQPGRYRVELSNPGNDPPYIFDRTHQILIPKTNGLKFRPVDEEPASKARVQIEMPRPTGYKPFRVLRRTLRPGSYVRQPQDFPLGHVLQYSCTGAALVGLSGFPIPVSSGVLSNLHIFNEDPAGPHAEHHLNVLNGLFDPDLGVDMYDDFAHPAATPGCDLQYAGMSALDECDLSELPRYAKKPVETKTNIDPASCVTYIYDECQPVGG
jgi:hypothetical protein